MNVLIVENELYLAQSISTKLSEIGYRCEIATNIKNATKDEKFDAVLLSTNISGQNFYPVIEKHKNSIIILMITYISNDTISNPIKAGANDYIQKPFMIEELIRKLEHLKNYNLLISKNNMLKKYIENSFLDINIEKTIDKKITSPILIKCSQQSMSDALVFNYCKAFNESFELINLRVENNFEKLSKYNPKKLFYITNFQDIKKNDKEKFFTMIDSKRVILSSTDVDEYFPYSSLTLQSSSNFFHRSDILTIEDYIKHIVINFQSKLPDTELSKKLGLSRKSLWERRKKYGISKK